MTEFEHRRWGKDLYIRGLCASVIVVLLWCCSGVAQVLHRCCYGVVLGSLFWMAGKILANNGLSYSLSVLVLSGVWEWALPKVEAWQIILGKIVSL